MIDVTVVITVSQGLTVVLACLIQYALCYTLLKPIALKPFAGRLFIAIASVHAVTMIGFFALIDTLRTLMLTKSYVSLGAVGIGVFLLYFVAICAVVRSKRHIARIFLAALFSILVYGLYPISFFGTISALSWAGYAIDL